MLADLFVVRQIGAGKLAAPFGLKGTIGVYRVTRAHHGRLLPHLIR